MRIRDMASWVEEAPGLGALPANARMRPEDQASRITASGPPRLTPEVDIQPALLSFNPWIATENVRSS
jgi:hypothetical protein